MSMRRWTGPIGVVALGLMLGACLVTPEPLNFEDRAAQAAADREEMFQAQDPVERPVDIYEAMARTLKYNLDYRLSLMEQALEEGQLELLRLEMLPTLRVNGTTSGRSNINASRSESLATRTQTLEDSFSQQRHRHFGDLTATWDLLDFGVSYFEAKQQTDRVLAARERERRLVHNLLQEVRGAFWRAASAQRLQPRVTDLLAQTSVALDKSEQVAKERLQSPVQALRFQKALLEVIRQMRGLQADLAQSKATLAALMNVPPGTDFTLSFPDIEERALPKVTLSLDEMEVIALNRRPELREEAYKERVAVNEVRKAFVKMLPSPALLLGRNYDSNAYLVNHAWTEASARVTWNLFSVLSGPKEIEVAEAQQQVSVVKRMALSVAVLSQVHVSYHQFRQALIDHNQALKLRNVEAQIYSKIRNVERTDAGSTLERIRAEAGSIAAELRSDRAHAELQSAASRIFVSMGLDPLPERANRTDLEELRSNIKLMIEEWERGNYPMPDQLIAEQQIQQEKQLPYAGKQAPVSVAEVPEDGMLLDRSAALASPPVDRALDSFAELADIVPDSESLKAENNRQDGTATVTVAAPDLVAVTPVAVEAVPLDSQITVTATSAEPDTAESLNRRAIERHRREQAAVRAAALAPPQPAADSTPPVPGVAGFADNAGAALSKRPAPAKTVTVAATPADEAQSLPNRRPRHKPVQVTWSPAGDLIAPQAVAAGGQAQSTLLSAPRVATVVAPSRAPSRSAIAETASRAGGGLRTPRGLRLNLQLETGATD